MHRRVDEMPPKPQAGLLYLSSVMLLVLEVFCRGSNLVWRQGTAILSVPKTSPTEKKKM